jgi:HEAT repeat protein
MAQDQLQTLKLEISKNTKLLPYERIAFHKIFGIVKTENGMQILLKELNSIPLVRESAVLILKEFNNKEVQNAFLTLLDKQISDIEKVCIFKNFEKFGTQELLKPVIDYIERNKTNTDNLQVLLHAFNVLRAIGSGSDEVKIFLKTTALNKELTESLRALAIISLSAFKDIVVPVQKETRSFLEEILKEGSDEIVCAAYNSISILNDNIITLMQKNKRDEDEIFTYSPEKDDRAILDIRVLIGKMTSRFDAYSNKSKIALINAMISSNHRELLIYTMKALTSNDAELIDMTLDLLLANTHKLLDPDKLFRNLISLSIDSPRGNELIVNIFERYFNNLKDIRRNMVFKDKLYNYLVVTLETYFESYRKNFMVAEVMEKNYPENVQKIRNFILNKFTPNYKKKILNYLKSNDSSILNNILAEIAILIPYVSDNEREGLTFFLEILCEKDMKSREISASRIDDINFEKRYLKERIIRICDIIGKLKIDNGASPLVIIYNYIKKYPDKDIFDAVSNTLSMLNYSYMLGELEVQLSTGDEGEQQKAVQYLSLFSDQRLLNIIIDYLKQHLNENSNIMVMLLTKLLRQDLFGNVTADSVLKELIEKNPNEEIKRLSILCLGKCAREADIQFLDQQFNSLKDNTAKEAVVQAIEHIMNYGLEINKRPIRNLLMEYIKDPGIKVRIHACYLLIKMGNINALKSIMDMMTIKNKKIQRDIILLFGNLKSIEFGYFLISLLKDQYAISGDIISYLTLLPNEELKEIDHFIANIFKKHEFINVKETNPMSKEAKPQPIDGFSEGKYYILNIEINELLEKIKSLNIIEIMMLHQQINNIVISEISLSNGILARIINGKILAFFKDPITVSNTALSIYHNFNKFNSSRLPADRLDILLQILSQNIKIINDEIINLDESKIQYLRSLPVYNRIIIDDDIKTLSENEFYSDPLPDLEFLKCTTNDHFHEMIGPLNFIKLSKIILDELSIEISQRQKKEIELETEIKQKLKQQNKSPVAIAYGQALDDLGRILKDDLNEVNKYIQKRTTDRELLTNVSKMLSNVYKRFFVEKSKIFSEIE